MSADRFKRLSELFESARELDPSRRAAFIRDACGGDDELRIELEALLSQHDSQSPLDGTSPGTAARIVADVLDDMPDSIGDYRLTREIGRGGMGVVYEAEQKNPARSVALKIIKLGMDTREVVARFDAERRALAQMDHPSIAHVYDAGATENGRPFFVMELVDGVPITRACDDRGLSLDERLRLFSSVCQAIQHAHQKGIIHRDIKPSNILVTDLNGEPVPKVIDFGIAKATDTDAASHTIATLQGQIIGTPAYMSPEQADLTSSDIDTRSDIYALGVLLYEMLTGVTPFVTDELLSKGFSEMARQIRETNPKKPSTRIGIVDANDARAAWASPSQMRTALRRDLDWVALKCLEKDRASRYESAGELASEIERVLANEPVLAGPQTTAYRLRKFVRRNRGRVVATSLIILALSLGVVGTTTGLLLAIDERDRAQTLATAEADARSEAQDAADTAEATVTFLLDDLLGAADPARTENRDLTVREAVALASASIDDQFTARPRVEARIRSTLGRVLTQLGQYTDAEAHIRREWRLAEEAAGSNSLESIASMTTLASNLMHQSRFDDAIELTRDQLDRLENATFEQAAELRLQALSNLGVAHLQLGQYADAAPILEQSLDAKRAMLGDLHESTLTSVHNLAGLYGSLGQHDRSLELARAAYEGRLEILGPGDPRTFGSLNLIAWMLRTMERYDEADLVIEIALTDARERLGPDHPNTRVLAKTHSIRLLQQGELELAEKILREILASQRRTDPQISNINTLSTIQNLARALVEQEKNDEALSLMQEALPIARTLYPPGSSELLSIVLLSGRAHSQAHRFEQADELLLESHRMLAEGAKKKSDIEADLYGWIADHYDRWHEASPGNGYGERAGAWRSKITGTGEPH